MFLGIWLLIMVAVWNEARPLSIEKLRGDTSGYIINWEQQIIEITARAEDNLNFRNKLIEESHYKRNSSPPSESPAYLSSQKSQRIVCSRIPSGTRNKSDSVYYNSIKSYRLVCHPEKHLSRSTSDQTERRRH